jgi:NAD(P)-dependent dehydrogenase (short-subunit alcohol dehydrogenase family)
LKIMAASNVWLVTGASRGLGFEISKAALQAGHKVIAGRRSAIVTSEITEIEKLGGIWIDLDVTAVDLEVRVEKAKAVFGRIDVLVNNAGYGTGGMAEDVR